MSADLRADHVKQPIGHTTTETEESQAQTSQASLE